MTPIRVPMAGQVEQIPIKSIDTFTKLGLPFSFSIRTDDPQAGLFGEYNSPLIRHGSSYPRPVNNRNFHVHRAG